MSYKIKVTITVPNLREAKIVLEQLKHSLNSNFGEYDIDMKKLKKLKVDESI